MNVNSILQGLKAERDRLNKAIDALEGLNSARKAGRIGRPKGATTPARRGRRRMSAAARAKLSRLLKRRWAARKKAGRSSLGS